MEVRRLLCTFAALALAAVLLGACGDGASRDEYEAGLRRVKAHLDDAADASLASGQATDEDVKQAKLEEAHAALEAAADEAKTLDAPNDALEANEDFAKALREYADLYGELAALEPNDPAATQLYSRAGDIAERLDSANRRLAKAGYRVRDKEQDE
jgi:hypothetical protein